MLSNDPAQESRHVGACGEWFFHNMPKLACGIVLHAKYRDYQARSASGHGLKRSSATRGKLCAIQKHLPPHPSCHARLLTYIDHSCRE